MVISTRAADGIERRSIPPHTRGSWFPHAFGLTMAHLRQALAAGRAPLSSVQDNLAVMAVVEATYRSGAEHRAISVEEIMGDRYQADYGPGYTHGYSEWQPPTSDVAVDEAAA